MREFLHNYWKKNKPITIKTVRLVIKRWSPKAVITKMTVTASEISDQESEKPDLEPQGNSDVPYSEETASSEILLQIKGPCYYCNGEKVYERAVVKCPRCFWQDGYRICPICAHQIQFLLLVNT